jgi:hypothetical protein
MVEDLNKVMRFYEWYGTLVRFDQQSGGDNIEDEGRGRLIGSR